jgi:hypothetical protein
VKKKYVVLEITWTEKLQVPDIKARILEALRPKFPSRAFDITDVTEKTKMMRRQLGLEGKSKPPFPEPHLEGLIE